MQAFEIIDISQPISQSTACFPGDTPFSSEIAVTVQDSQFMNLSAFTMSPHLGTHADAPIHLKGDMAHPEHGTQTAGQMPLTPFIGPAVVIDLAPWPDAISWSQVEPHVAGLAEFPKRILFRTQQTVRYQTFEERYAWFSPELIRTLAQRGVILVGLDTPSVDPMDSQTLETHHALLEAGMYWLENLDLTAVPASPASDLIPYFLVALPLKLMELEASPVRAVLLKWATSY